MNLVKRFYLQLVKLLFIKFCEKENIFVETLLFTLHFGMQDMRTRSEANCLGSLPMLTIGHTLTM